MGLPIKMKRERVEAEAEDTDHPLLGGKTGDYRKTSSQGWYRVLRYITVFYVVGGWPLLNIAPQPMEGFHPITFNDSLGIHPFDADCT